MNEHGSFHRKIAYLVALAVLLFPISQLGAPSTLNDPGGKLARLRTEHNLGEADLGEIDPASATIRLATLGLRGIAVSLLWSKANQYKKKEDWTNFRATLSQLAKLQPYFIAFWKYQAWNLSYNVSVELDNVRDRYYYVKRGIEFLKQGIRYNRDSPALLSELGWFIGNKIGRADEHVEFRRLFKADDDFHPADRPPEQRDNWLVSRWWYEKAVSAVDDKKKSLGQKNPTTFYSNPARSQFDYSEAIEEEGTFGEKAKAAWATAARLWRNYGNRELRSSLGFSIRLADLDRWEEETKKLEEQLDNLSPGVREELLAERRAALSPEQLQLLDVSEDQLTAEQAQLYSKAQQKLEITPQSLADRIAEKSPEKALEAKKLASHIAENKIRIFLIKNNRQVVNYGYWKSLGQLEQTSAALKARELAYAGERAFRDDADLLKARRLFEQSFDSWAKVLAAHPEFPAGSPLGSDILDYVNQYSTILEQLDLSLADEAVDRRFPLWDIVEANDMEKRYDEAIAKHLRRQESQLKDSSPRNGQDANSSGDAADAAESNPSSTP